MSNHNIGFYEEISKIVPLLSSNTHLISSLTLVLAFVKSSFSHDTDHFGVIVVILMVTEKKFK